MPHIARGISDFYGRHPRPGGYIIFDDNVRYYCQLSMTSRQPDNWMETRLSNIDTPLKM